MPESPPSPPLEVRPGELEWRLWLDDRGALDAPDWVTALSREATTRIEDADPGSAIRLLELAVSPASPVFDGLTGPRARELAGRLVKAWEAVGSRDEAVFGPWEDRLGAILAVLRRWVRYRRHRRRERAEASAASPPEERSRDDLDAFYRDWVLIPLRENFLRVLEDRGVTRRQFCASLGMSEAYLSQILNGRRNPSLRKLSEISRALEVDLGRLFAVRAHRGSDSPWGSGSRPEPGDTPNWYPGKVSRPYAALEAHYRLIFYPGPDLPGEKILARSFLIVDPVPGELAFEGRYALQDENEVVLVASYAGTSGGGKRQRFMATDGRTLEVPVSSPQAGEDKVSRGESHFLGRVTGTLVEF
jgi:transcriptional regulator with XRE-family HTH domain